jgi:ATP-dependent exoDNAse (exonuclease V) beta subunit
VAAFLDGIRAQGLPADTLAETGLPPDGVRLLTAHRAKGLEWRLVVVAHVQHGAWPDLRSRSTLLGTEELGAGEVLPPLSPRALLAEERRLFYVACTRARERLVVTAVRSLDDDGEQPSRFLHELVDDDDHREVPGRPPRAMSLGGLVAELRYVVCDPSEPASVRGAAALRLARLASTTVAGRAIAPAADPDRWWGIPARTSAEAPLVPPDGVPRLAASDLTTSSDCPAKWFLERRAGGRDQSSVSQEFGTLVHAIAEAVGRAEIDPTADLMVFVDRVWAQLRFDTPWASDQEREEAKEALDRFAAWHTADRGRELIGVEQPLRARIELPDGREVEIHGYADRLELDVEGRVVTVDLKTNKQAPTAEKALVHPQLGLYQLAVDHGAVDDLLPGARSGGAELVQLRHRDRTGSVKVVTQKPQQRDGDGWLPVERQISVALDSLTAERFPATPGAHCTWCSISRFCPAKTEGRLLT